MVHRKPLPLIVALVALCTVARAEPKVLYEKQSRFNTIVVTEDDRGLRTLWFEKGGAKQSVVKPGDPDHLDLAYSRAVPAALALVPAPKRVLIIGLGGGSIPMFLHKHFPDAMIDVVDIDPDVVEVAKKYFGFREDATLRAHAVDGRRFIEQCRQPYDFILLDAFGADSIPYDLATREFLQAVLRAVTRQGIVVGNVWSRDSNPLYDAMVRTYQDVFADLHIIDVKTAGNKILLASPRPVTIARGDFAQRATRIAKERKFRFDPGAVVLDGFEHPAKDNSVEVLRDEK